MKRKSIFSLIAVSFAMVLGAVGALKFSNNAAVKETKAASSVADGTYYFNPNIWNTGGAWFTVYLYGNGSEFVDVQEVSTDPGVYKFTTSKAYPNLIFLRQKDSSTTKDFSNIWNQTEDLSFDATKNCFKVTGWSDGASGNSSGSWMAYEEPAAPAVYSIRIGEGQYENMVENNASEVKTASTVSLSVGNMIYFQKDGVDLVVTPKDDDQLTRVVSDDGALRVIQDINDYLYLNISSNKLWAGQYTYTAGNYLVGSFNGWSPKEAIALPAASATFAANDEIKAVTLTANQKAIAGENYINISSLVSHPNGSVVVENNNAKIVTAGTYSVTVSDGVYTFTKSDYVANYKLRIGDTDYPMTHHEGNEWKLENVNLSHGDIIGYKEDNVLVSDSFAKVVANNNLKANKTVLADAEDVTVYVDVVSKSIWVGGLPLGGFHLLVNGHEIVTLTHTSDFDGYTQYGRDGVEFAVNDTIEYVNCGIDNSLPVVFHDVELNVGGLGGNFEIVSSILKCKTACTAEVYLKISNARNEIYLGAEREEIALARNYASGFITAMNTACKAASGYVGVVQSEVETAWATQASKYSGLAGEVKTELKKGGESTVQEVKDFAANYAGIFAKRGGEWDLDEFMEWGLSSSNTSLNPVLSNNSNDIVMIIVTISSISLIALGGFFFLKKRKESK